VKKTGDRRTLPAQQVEFWSRCCRWEGPFWDGGRSWQSKAKVVSGVVVQLGGSEARGPRPHKAPYRVSGVAVVTRFSVGRCEAQPELAARSWPRITDTTRNPRCRTQQPRQGCSVLSFGLRCPEAGRFSLRSDAHARKEVKACRQSVNLLKVDHRYAYIAHVQELAKVTPRVLDEPVEFSACALLAVSLLDTMAGRRPFTSALWSLLST
jgi:hypothetical protein